MITDWLRSLFGLPYMTSKRAEEVIEYLKLFHPMPTIGDMQGVQHCVRDLNERLTHLERIMQDVKETVRTVMASPAWGQVSELAGAFERLRNRLETKHGDYDEALRDLTESIDRIKQVVVTAGTFERDRKRRDEALMDMQKRLTQFGELGARIAALEKAHRPKRKAKTKRNPKRKAGKKK